MKKFTTLLLVCLLFITNTSASESTKHYDDSTIKTFMGVDFLSMNPNRLLFGENFFTENTNPGIGLSVHFCHVPKYVGFYAEMYYQHNNMVKVQYNHESVKSGQVISYGGTIGVLGFIDIFGNSGFILSPMAGFGLGNINYPGVNFISEKISNYDRSNPNESESFIKHVGIQGYLNLEKNVYLKFGYDLKWANLRFKYPVNPLIHNDQKIAMNVIHLGISFAY